MSDLGDLLSKLVQFKGITDEDLRWAIFCHFLDKISALILLNDILQMLRII